MHCHARAEEPGEGRQVVLVGHPNVGKSALFGRLAGRYVTVSNHPGTTVEVARATLDGDGTLVDTPGLHTLVARTDDERVTLDLLLRGGRATVVQVADAKNLRRGLQLSLELAEAGLPFVLALNMADEAASRGILVDARALSELLGVPVVPTVAVRGEGVADLVARLGDARPALWRVRYHPAVEEAVDRVVPVLPRTGLAPCALALLLLAAGEEAGPVRLGPRERAAVRLARAEAEARLGEPFAVAVARARLAEADAILERVVRRGPARPLPGEAFARLASHPVAGWPILAAVLAGLFLFVGILGAGWLVGLLEDGLFGSVVNPFARRFVGSLLGSVPVARDFLVGPYGLVTMALTYAVAIVLPIVTTFFLAFGVLEDSGYLPRLAVMLDRAFRLMGLNGRAVIPMILGLGCDTMATLTTRTLDSRRDRVQVTLLLALAVPCSAQLGVILGMISRTGPVGVAVWGAVVAGTLLSVGRLSARLLPGPRSDFVVELPPMRVPSLRNIALKTAARLEWYGKEVVPVFVLGTAALFVLDRTGLLAAIERALSPLVVGWLGLPAGATGAFLVGFLRRDYGAAGLFSLARAGQLSAAQVLVSLIVITLFVPCVANLLMIVKEHGRRTAAAVAAFVFPFAFLVGGLVRLGIAASGLGVG